VEEAKEMRDYYSILGVNKDADEIVIKAAYKALAQKYHPDKYDAGSDVQSSKLMSDINKAYSVIGNPVSKQKYDQELFGTNHSENKIKAAASTSASTAKPKQSAPVYEQHESEPKESQLPAIIFGIVAWSMTIYYIVTTIQN